MVNIETLLKLNSKIKRCLFEESGILSDVKGNKITPIKFWMPHIINIFPESLSHMAKPPYNIDGQWIQVSTREELIF